MMYVDCLLIFSWSKMLYPIAGKCVCDTDFKGADCSININIKIEVDIDIDIDYTCPGDCKSVIIIGGGFVKTGAWLQCQYTRIDVSTMEIIIVLSRLMQYSVTDF